MTVRLEQHGDFVREIRISKPSTVVRHRHTWKSAIGLGVSTAFLGLGMWFDGTGDDDITRAAAAVCGLLAHLIGGRWRIEERQPLPKAAGLIRAYRTLQATEAMQFLVILGLTYWIGFTGVGGRFWLAFLFLVPGAFASSLLIERGYKALFSQIVAEREALKPDAS